MTDQAKKMVCNKINNKWCKHFLEVDEGECLHSHPHIELYTCLEKYCETIGDKVECKRIKG